MSCLGENGKGLNYNGFWGAFLTWRDQREGYRFKKLNVHRKGAKKKSDRKDRSWTLQLLLRPAKVLSRHPGETPGPVGECKPVLDTGRCIPFGHLRRYDGNFILHRAEAIIEFLCVTFAFPLRLCGGLSANAMACKADDSPFFSINAVEANVYEGLGACTGGMPYLLACRPFVSEQQDPPTMELTYTLCRQRARAGPGPLFFPGCGTGHQ